MFNKNQIEAISHKDGPAMVLAGPGSGKTTVITQRVKNLIENCKVSPEKILVVTFTKAAAVQMQERFLKAMNGNEEKRKIHPVTFGTFHSVYYKILKNAYQYNGDNIITERLKSNYIREIAIRLKIDVSSMQDFVQSAGSEISKIKGNILNLDDYYSSCCDRKSFHRLFIEYEKTLAAEGKIDFDDILLKCYHLLQKREDVLQQWQNVFQYILIDEFQDINFVQYEIIKLLARPENNIFIVGDDDQSIYGFRGAYPEIMFQFREEFTSVKEIFLNINYRSTPEIVQLAENLISHNGQRFDKKMESAREKQKNVDVREFHTQCDELKYVCAKIKKYIRQGVSLSDIAILIRSNSQAGVIENFMYNEKIPIKSEAGKRSIYESMVAKDILAYIRAACFEKSRPICENDNLIYILNKPPRFISRHVIGQEQVNFEKLKQIYEHNPQILRNIEQLQFHLKMLSGLNPTAALIYIRNGIGYEKYLRDYSIDKKVKMENLFEQLDKIQSEAAKFATVREWFDDIEKQKAENVTGQESGINIMTMHGAKGLEFKVVFIIDANQGVIPSTKMIKEKDFQEERRVFYVALTRAADLLHVYSITESLGYPVSLSMFVSEMMESYNDKLQ